MGNSIQGWGIFPGFVFLSPQIYRKIARVLVHVLHACIKTPDQVNPEKFTGKLYESFEAGKGPLNGFRQK